MTHREIIAWLQENDQLQLEQLWCRADQTRRQWVGDAVHLRGLVEFSNVCERQCSYCGLRAANKRLPRYRMSIDEIMQCAHSAVKYGYGTVVLQSGEDWALLSELDDYMHKLVKAVQGILFGM